MRPLVAIALLAVLVCGCGEEYKPEPPPKAKPEPQTPLAVKKVHFGVAPRDVATSYKPLDKVSEALGVTVYSHKAVNAAPIVSYTFEFIDDKLSGCQIVYDGAAFDQTIKRDEFFQTIESKYQVKSDFSTSENRRRWINLDTKLTVTWQEDLKRKVNVLTVVWDAMDEVRKARQAAMDRERKKQTQPDGAAPPKKVDMGI